MSELERTIPRGRLDGRTALITGAASGIGKATSILFAEEGAIVALADIDQPGAQRSADDITAKGGTAISYSLDVTSEDDWLRVVEDFMARHQRLDVLVNNAGISFAKAVSEMTLAEWRRVTSVNLDGVFLGTRHAVRAMRRSGGGSIVNVASASGVKASAGASAYCASKAAVRMFSKTAALECAGDNIRVNTVSPGGVMTPMWENMEFWRDLKAQTGSDEASYQVLSSGVPLKRLATAEEVARAILYLASSESSFVTGADLSVDGGYTA